MRSEHIPGEADSEAASYGKELDKIRIYEATYKTPNGFNEFAIIALKKGDDSSLPDFVPKSLEERAIDLIREAIIQSETQRMKRFSLPISKGSVINDLVLRDTGFEANKEGLLYFPDNIKN